MSKKSQLPKNYQVVPRNRLEQILKQDGMFLFGKNNQNMLKQDLTIYMGEKKFHKCKDIDQAIEIINYYF